jgi:hypothetical protein
MKQFAPLFCFLLAVCGAAQAQAPIAFPQDGGIVDVRDYGATPNDETDDTAALQKALDAFPNGNRIVYLPQGTWIVTDALRWPKGTGGNGEKRTILQGAGISLTKVRLPDGTPGFGDEKPKALIWTGEKPAQRFRNAVRDLTIEVGKNNPGAIGLQFNASNQGTIRNVAIIAAEDSGKIGLDMGFTDEIGPLLVRNLKVEGFETGIVTKWPVNSITFENIHLRGQRKLGWHNYHQMIFVRGLVSENKVTAIYNEKDSWGTVTLLDSKIIGLNPPPNTPGILNQRQMVFRNVEISGYPVSVDNADKGRDKGDVVAPALIGDDTSHANVSSLFREVKDKTFTTAGEIKNLPIKETPEIEWGDSATWANIIKFGADPTGKNDSSAALQAAIDSGAHTVYLPAGAEFRFESEVELRGPIRRIIGLEGRFVTEGKAVWKLVDGKHLRGLPDAPTVIIERMNGRSGGHSITLRHESKRALVVSSVIGFETEGRGNGDIFLDDFCGRLMLYQAGQSAWCRQLNTEHNGTMLQNNGAKLWILGMKTEKIGTIIETLGGGVTDANGVFLYANQGWTPEVPAFIISQSSVTLRGINQRNFTQKPITIWVRETQGGQTKELAASPWVFLSR